MIDDQFQYHQRLVEILEKIYQRICFLCTLIALLLGMILGLLIAK